MLGHITATLLVFYEAWKDIQGFFLGKWRYFQFQFIVKWNSLISLNRKNLHEKVTNEAYALCMQPIYQKNDWKWAFRGDSFAWNQG